MTAKLRDLYTFEEVEDLSTGRIGILTDLDDVRREITDALGDFAGDFDLDAIADEAYTLAVPVDESGHVDGAPRYVCAVDEGDFWEIAKRHDIS